ncbi:hypothetical protein NHQ30_011655 [Ciborinia camelliae]|nr:hypothetical protein NHQ30_011655 [Ciborinia camelliae]
MATNTVTTNATTNITTNTNHQQSNATKEPFIKDPEIDESEMHVSPEEAQHLSLPEIDRLMLLPSNLFLHGREWVALNLTIFEEAKCCIDFDNLCLLAWETPNLSSWRIEYELSIIASEWAEKKKAPGKAFLRDALPEAKKYGFLVRFS